MTFRFRRLATAGALALPATLLTAGALTALLPAAAARAATPCTAGQATVTFEDGTFTCQAAGATLYPQDPAVVKVCAGRGVLAFVVARTTEAILAPGSCVALPAFGLPLPVNVDVLPALPL